LVGVIGPKLPAEIPEGIFEVLRMLTLTCTLAELLNAPECPVTVIGTARGRTSVRWPVVSIVAISVRSSVHRTGVALG